MKLKGTTTTTTTAATNATVARRHEIRQGQVRTEFGREQTRQKTRTCMPNKDNFGDDSNSTAISVSYCALLRDGLKLDFRNTSWRTLLSDLNFQSEGLVLPRGFGFCRCRAFQVGVLSMVVSRSLSRLGLLEARIRALISALLFGFWSSGLRSSSGSWVRAICNFANCVLQCFCSRLSFGSQARTISKFVFVL